MTGAERIAAERQRQIDVAGYTPEHDDAHSVAQLWAAAEAYVLSLPSAWPWEPETYKPTSRARDLEKAGALYLAAAERAQRAADAVARRLDRLTEASR